MVGRLRERAHSAAHGFVGCAKDIDAIDFLNVDDCTGPEDFGALGELLKQAFPFCVGEFLRVGENGVHIARWKNNRGCDDRTSQRSSASFIDACHKTQTSRTKTVFVREAANLWTVPH